MTVRTFYIFKIKKEMSALTHNTPYSLFRTIENLYYLDNINLGLSFRLYDSIFESFDKEYMNNTISKIYKDNNYYVKDTNRHMVLNKYKPENSYLYIYRSHLLLKTDAIKPTLLTNYTHSDNLFVCDFKNKDYFWLNEFVY